jgi:DNA-binding NarL/FixJ family response regulator
MKQVESYQPHLVITDITMPGMDGYELVRWLRQRPVSRMLPVIFLTGRTEVPDRVRGYQTGGDVYLPKPFELEELGAVVRNLLERLHMVESEWRSRQSGQGSLGENATPIAAPDKHLDLSLTEREREVLLLLVNGFSNNQIGDRLHLSPRTIEKYVSRLLSKTDTNNRAELVHFVMMHHLAE